MKWIKRNQSKSIMEAHLANLGISHPSEINRWIIDLRNNNCKIQKMNAAVALLKAHCNDHIFICGDYDCDGIMAVSILYDALKKSGAFPNLHFRVPKRFSEGYGLSCSMVDSIFHSVEGPITLLTVDNGIVAFDAIERAKQYGMTVIVTDHHLGLTDELTGNLILPDADVIIDPAAIPGSAKFSGYCGAGIAYKLVCELFGIETATTYLPLAATATIADVMDLNGENFAIVWEGLRILNSKELSRKMLPGFGTLIQRIAQRNAKHGDFTSEDIGFQVVPVLNAPGRLFDDGAIKSINLMLSTRLKALQLSNDLIEINENRKEAVKKALECVPKFEDPQNIIVQYVPNINLGIVGIVAGQICEMYNRPTIILTEDTSDPTKLRGSARSIEDVHIKNVLDQTTTLDHYGGHAGAAGLGLLKSNLDNFIGEINKISATIQLSNSDVCYYDLEILAKDVPAALADTEKFAPFGQGNPKLVFKIVDFDVIPYDGEYKKKLGESGVRFNAKGCQAVGFGLASQLEPYKKPSQLTLYGSLSMNVYNETKTPQIQFVDFEVMKEASIHSFPKKL